jgi:hypothetical protein
MRGSLFGIDERSSLAKSLASGHPAVMLTHYMTVGPVLNLRRSCHEQQSHQQIRTQAAALRELCSPDATLSQNITIWRVA